MYNVLAGCRRLLLQEEDKEEIQTVTSSLANAKGISSFIKTSSHFHNKREKESHFHKVFIGRQYVSAFIRTG